MDLFIGLGVTGLSGGTLPDLKDAEITKFDPAFPLENFQDNVKKALRNRLG